MLNLPKAIRPKTPLVWSISPRESVSAALRTLGHTTNAVWRPAATPRRVRDCALANPAGWALVFSLRNALKLAGAGNAPANFRLNRGGEVRTLSFRATKATVKPTEGDLQEHCG